MSGGKRSPLVRRASEGRPSLARRANRPITGFDFLVAESHVTADGAMEARIALRGILRSGRNRDRLAAVQLLLRSRDTARARAARPPASPTIERQARAYRRL